MTIACLQGAAHADPVAQILARGEIGFERRLVSEIDEPRVKGRQICVYILMFPQYSPFLRVHESA